MSLFSVRPGRPPVGTVLEVVGTVGRYAKRSKIPPGLVAWAKLGRVVTGVGWVLLAWDLARAGYQAYRWLSSEVPNDDEEVGEQVD